MKTPSLCAHLPVLKVSPHTGLSQYLVALANYSNACKIYSHTWTNIEVKSVCKDELRMCMYKDECVCVCVFSNHHSYNILLPRKLQYINTIYAIQVRMHHSVLCLFVLRFVYMMCKIVMKECTHVELLLEIQHWKLLLCLCSFVVSSLHSYLHTIQSSAQKNAEANCLALT